jgi:hypothetical protein
VIGSIGLPWHEAEVNRIAGEVALLSAEPDAAKAEAYLEHALAVARTQQAKSWPVWHVQHDSTNPNSHYRPGQPGNEFKPEVARWPVSWLSRNAPSAPSSPLIRGAATGWRSGGPGGGGRHHKQFR